MKDLNALKTKISKIKSNNKYWAFINKPIKENAFLLEAGQGKNVNGSVFALLKQICLCNEIGEAKIYLSIELGTKEIAQKKLDNYDISGIVFVERGSEKYKEILATAKYLITDNSFPVYFYKRPEQIYVNTWHGTPLKTLGRSDISNATSIANVQANMLKADYLLYPNTYTKDVMMRDYMVNKLFKHKTVLLDYPRNDALFARLYEDEIRDRYNLFDKKLIAYMPTWRGTGRIANIEGQVREVEEIISNISSSLKKEEVLCINLHFLIGNNIDISQYDNVIMFPDEYETYDFLGICDTLITDYSSVALDFAQTGRDVILYMYDYEEYKESKGFYFDIRTLPFKQTYTIEELKKEIHSAPKNYKLDEKFLSHNTKNASERLIDLICFDNDEGLEIEDYDKENLTNLVYVENLIRPDCETLLDLYFKDLSDKEKSNTVIAFENKINDEVAAAIRKLPAQIDVIRIEHDTFKGRTDAISTFLKNRVGLMKKQAEDFYKREEKRLIEILNIHKLTVLMIKNLDRVFALSYSSAKTCMYELPSYFFRHNGALINKRPVLYKELIQSFDEKKNFKQEDLISAWGDTICYGIDAVMKRRKYKASGEKLVINGLLSVETELDYKIGDKVTICDRQYELELRDIKVTNNKNAKRVTANASITIPLKDMVGFIKLNRVFIDLESEAGTIKTAISNGNWRNKLKIKKINLPADDLNCYFQDSKVYLTVEIRQANRTDAFYERTKLFFAWLCSLITPKHKPIVLFEKESSRYEESASIVYERLLESGYDNAYFILDKDYKHWDEIPDKYKKNILKRFSFKHYYNLFAAKTFISSEMLSHSLEISSSSKLFQNKIVNGFKNYVFLQHGVMYMVSLNSESRMFFRRRSDLGIQRVVVSSSLEAQHFTGYTPYTDEEIYVSGLPKFDKSYLSDDANLITIMLTWRPWEYVSAVQDFSKTKYYQMLSRIISSIPKKYLDRVVVLPHPRLTELVMNKTEDEVWKHFLPDVKYDDILKKTKILITDYSSISYDAFYRGSNIIFCWGEKDECMKEYGGDAKLMLTEDLAFGPVTYNEKIGNLVSEMYESEQEEKYIENYRKIVEFHDNQNTNRVIEMMKRDNLIEK